MLLNNKTVVITGAGSGVGRASALLFAAEGAKVVCADINADWAKQTAADIEADGGRALGVTCDVIQEADVVAAIDTAATRFGRLDVMFNNAGISTPRLGMRFEEHDTDDFERLVAVNLRGVFFGMKHAVIRFKQQGGGGVIVNTASVAGLVGWGGAVYGSTKGGVVQLTRAVAVECAPDDIRVNAICPAGMPRTNFLLSDAPEASTGVPDDLAQQIAATHPLGREITAEDCAAAALFLASDQAHNITGVMLPVDGGYVAR